MLIPKYIYLKTAPPPPKIELLVFDADSKKCISENSPPPPQKLNFYFLMLSPKIIYLKTAPPPPPIELLTWDADYRYEGSQRGDFYCLWRLIWPGGQCFILMLFQTA